MNCTISFIYITPTFRPYPYTQMQPPMVSYYDQSSILMNARTGTPMRLVSPAPVMVPPGAQRAPQAPQIYPPPPQSAQPNMYTAQNGNSVGGKGSYIAHINQIECVLCVENLL